jgi:hypothetical protein
MEMGLKRKSKRRFDRTPELVAKPGKEFKTDVLGF